MEICVDMGHTPTSPGASGYLDELREDREIGRRLIAELESRGHTVVNTTPPDSMGYPNEINQRIRAANASGADLFVSIHLNAGGGTGTEVLYYKGDAAGKKYASAISSNLASALGLPNRGAKPRTNEVGVIRDTVMTAVLVEVCFVDNAADKAAYDATSYAAIVNAIADGIEGNASSGGGTSQGGSKPSMSADMGRVTITYALMRDNGAWWPNVSDFNNSNDSGYAGAPYAKHKGFWAIVDKGSIRYKVHKMGGGWTREYRDGESCIIDGIIDGIACYYATPDGYSYQQVYYRSQTTERSGYLGVCCDYGMGSYDGWAGMYGEPLDRFQAAIRPGNPF